MTNAVVRSARKKAFLDAFARTGNLSVAGASSGISRRNHYNWMADDPAYALAFQEAEVQAADMLEAEARRRAVVGVDEPVFWKGETVGHVRRYSDTLLIFLLKGTRPEKYRENHRVEHTGAGGGPVEHVHRVAHVLDKAKALREGQVIDATVSAET